MIITEHIQYLLTCHDYVVVPGLGAFVVQYEPARFAADGFTLLPPGRVLSFNSIVTHDDGILAGSVARRESMGYESAKDAIARDVELLRHIISEDGYVEMASVGTFRRGQQGLLFEPCAVGNVVSAGFAGLPQLSLAMRPGVAVSEILEVDLAERHQRKMSRYLKPMVRYAAAVALLIVAGATLTTPVLIDDANIDRASLSLPKVTAPAPAARPTLEVEAPAAVAPEQTVAPAPSVQKVSELSDAACESDYKCFIIVASCATRAQADRFVTAHGGKTNLRVLKADGRYRVYAAVGNDYDEAFDYKTNNAEFTSAYPAGSWVYEKK